CRNLIEIFSEERGLNPIFVRLHGSHYTLAPAGRLSKYCGSISKSRVATSASHLRPSLAAVGGVFPAGKLNLTPRLWLANFIESDMGATFLARQRNAEHTGNGERRGEFPFFSAPSAVFRMFSGFLNFLYHRFKKATPDSYPMLKLYNTLTSR